MFPHNIGDLLVWKNTVPIFNEPRERQHIDLYRDRHCGSGGCVDDTVDVRDIFNKVYTVVSVDDDPWCDDTVCVMGLLVSSEEVLYIRIVRSDSCFTLILE